jgi:hypothetical protein
MRRSIRDILILVLLALLYDKTGLILVCFLSLAFFVFGIMRSKISSFWIAVVFSLLASSKLPESDFYVYMEQFKSISSISFVDFMSINIKSPLFYVLMWLIGTLVKSWAAASFFLIVIPNYIMYCVLRRLASDEVQLFLFSLLLFGFYPIYDQSNHLMRQYLASSILFTLIYAQRHILGLWITGFLSHLSFVAFFAINFTRNRIKYVVLIIPFLFVPQVYALLELFIFERNINVIDFNPLNSMQILLVSPVMIIAFLNKKAFIYTSLIILTMVIFYNNSEIVLRYWKYLLFFVPIVLIEIALLNRVLGHLLICFFIPLEYFYFIYNILNSTWTYVI